MIRAGLVAVAVAVAANSAAQAATYEGSFSIANVPNGPTSVTGTFRLTFNPNQSPIDNFTPDAFSISVGNGFFTPTNTRVDYFINGPAPRAFIFGRFDSSVGDVNNTISATPDFRLRFDLDNAFGLINSRGAFRLPVVTGYDNSMSDGSSATFSITAVPEPGTWMSMIAGFGLMGVAMRRRQPKTVS